MADKYYTDGYGTKRPIKMPFWESAKGQQVKKAGEIVGEAGAFALGTLLPFSRLKMIPKILGGIGIADFATSDRASELPKDIKEGNYGKAALTGVEGILTALAVAEGVKKLPGIRQSAENIAKNGLSKNNTVVHLSQIYIEQEQERMYMKFLRHRSMLVVMILRLVPLNQRI